MATYGFARLINLNMRLAKFDLNRRAHQSTLRRANGRTYSAILSYFWSDLNVLDMEVGVEW